MRRLVSLLVVLLLLPCLFVLTGCQRELVPPLVDVTDVSPRELELGDRLEILGTGFPQGRTARITFRGTLRRPGEPEATARIEADGAVASADRIEVAFGEALEERFCGHGDRAAHTTFTGELEVAFASSVSGAPPLVGTMRGVVLDARPSSVRAAVAEARAAEGARLLAFLGVTAGPPSGRGLPVESVAPGSPAARAGIQTGDVLAAIDGARVGQIGDMLPASARSIELSVRSGETAAEEARTIALVGYAGDRIPSEYGPAFVLVGVAVAVLLLLVLPTPALVGTIEMRLASRLRAATMGAILRSLFGRGPRAALSILASLLIGTFALGPHVVDADADGALLLVSAIALVTASRVAGARGLRASAREAGVALAFGALLAGSLVAMVLLDGAFQLGELVREQGGAPWQLAAARRPAAAVLAVAYLGALLLAIRRREAERSASVEILDRLGVLLACALGAAVFFGGWQLPGADGGRSLPLLLAGGAVFVVKTWALVVAVRGAASLASPWKARDARVFALRRVLPTLVAGVMLALLSRRLLPGGAFEGAFGATAVAVATLLTLRSALRVRDAMQRSEPHASPFL